jgi:ABC-type nitrate/sulfonate/bicarbonate transport system substrate-binding protein
MALRMKCIIGGLLAGVFTALAPAQAQTLDVVKIGIPSPLNTILAFWMADEAGFYKAQGIRVEFKIVEGGSRGAQMIRSGEIDVMQAGLSSVIEINKQGGAIRTIGSLSNVNRFVLFGAPGVAKAADLKGGVVAISSFGSETDTTVAIALEKLGLKREDVRVQEFGGGGARLEALRAGKAQASPLNEPSATLARAAGTPVLVDLAAEKYPWLFSSIVVSEKAIAEKRPLLLRFMKATIEGNHLAAARIGIDDLDGFIGGDRISGGISDRVAPRQNVGACATGHHQHDGGRLQQGVTSRRQHGGLHYSGRAYGRRGPA